jgi:hypothetical protein
MNQLALAVSTVEKSMALAFAPLAVFKNNQHSYDTLLFSPGKVLLPAC